MTRSESEKAAFYKAHKDDPDVWSDETERTPERSPLGASITIRISPEDAHLLKEAARRTGLRYSEIVREAVAQYVRPRYSFEFAIATQVFGQVKPSDARTVWTFGPLQPHTETAASNRSPRNPAIPA